MIRELIFLGAAVIAVLATLMVILNRNPVYAVIYLIMSLFSVAIVFYMLGAPFLAALEVIVYAGAIMVLFLFVVMMLNLGQDAPEADLKRPTRRQMIIPGVFALLLLIETVSCLFVGRGPSSNMSLGPEVIGYALYDVHYLGVELASLVLLIGIIGGMHLGRAASIPDATEAAQDAPR